ncbi:MAG: bifunctional DNA-formamidopyrimidine glycosylase/DNA-(apurinic or apyrimidinic site) lyase [Gemmataceae bacterium]
MPELPEVETVVRDLRPLLVGRRLTGVTAGGRKLRRAWDASWAERLVGAAVGGVRRRGKWIIVELDTGSRLVVHLGMTGQLTVAPTSDPTADHTHLTFGLSDGGQLRFRDVRRFGSVELFADDAAVTAYLADKLGPEPFDLDPVAFRDAVRRSDRPVKAILLDQTVVAGVGNIYADEALHRAGLHPQRRGPTVSPAEADRLRKAVVAVLRAAIDNRGSTIRDYVGGSGLAGGFQDSHRVYGRGGQPCAECGAVIAVVRVAGRSSHFCPMCQPFSREAESAEPSARSSHVPVSGKPPRSAPRTPPRG